MSGLKRFYVNFIPEGSFALDKSQSNHLANVLRMRKGEQFICNSGDGNDYLCRITAVDPKCVRAELLSVQKNECDPILQVTLFQAVCRGERMELIAQKISELGATALVPFVSAFTQFKTVRIDRLRTIAEESTKQCGRSSTLDLCEPIGFADACERLKEYDRIIFAYEQSHSGGLADALSGVSAQEKIALIVGSEGGFSPAEAQAFLELGARTVGLGKRILRAETAAIALTSAVMCLGGEWEE